MTEQVHAAVGAVNGAISPKEQAGHVTLSRMNLCHKCKGRGSRCRHGCHRSHGGERCYRRWGEFASRNLSPECRSRLSAPAVSPFAGLAG